jgi:hypothetical protein
VLWLVSYAALPNAQERQEAEPEPEPEHRPGRRLRQSDCIDWLKPVGAEPSGRNARLAPSVIENGEMGQFDRAGPTPSYSFCRSVPRFYAQLRGGLIDVEKEFGSTSHGTNLISPSQEIIERLSPVGSALIERSASLAQARGPCSVLTFNPNGIFYPCRSERGPHRNSRCTQFGRYISRS